MAYIGYTDNMIIDVATGIGKQATITVYDAGTANLSTIYTAPGGGALSNSFNTCLLYTSPSPRDVEESRMPSSA